MPACQSKIEPKEIAFAAPIRTCRPHQLPGNCWIVGDDLDGVKLRAGAVNQRPEGVFKRLRSEVAIELPSKTAEKICRRLRVAGRCGAGSCEAARRTRSELHILRCQPFAQSLRPGNFAANRLEIWGIENNLKMITGRILHDQHGQV